MQIPECHKEQCVDAPSRGRGIVENALKDQENITKIRETSLQEISLLSRSVVATEMLQTSDNSGSQEVITVSCILTNALSPCRTESLLFPSVMSDHKEGGWPPRSSYHIDDRDSSENC
jgi:hypothetical protein